MTESPHPPQSKVPEQPKESLEIKHTQQFKKNLKSKALTSPPPATSPPDPVSLAASAKRGQSSQPGPQAPVAPQEASDPSDQDISSSGAPPANEGPSIAVTLDVPPLDALRSPFPAAGAEEVVGGDGGGEWNLLVGKVRDWFVSDDLREQWSSLQGPLRVLGILIAGVFAIRVYSSLVSAINGIPVVSGLLELTGLVCVVRFSMKNLPRASERQELMATLTRRWKDFRGKLQDP